MLTNMCFLLLWGAQFAAGRSLAVVSMFLEAGARVDARNYFGANLLHLGAGNLDLSPGDLRAILALSEVHAEAPRLLRMPQVPRTCLISLFYMVRFPQERSLDARIA